MITVLMLTWSALLGFTVAFLAHWHMKQVLRFRRRVNEAKNLAEIDKIIDEDLANRITPVPLPLIVAAIAAGINGLAMGVVVDDLSFKIAASVILLVGINDLQRWVQYRAAQRASTTTRE